MHNVKIDVVNPYLYSQHVTEVDVSDLRNYGAGFRGSLTLLLEGGGERTFTGEHGGADYEVEYGFRLRDASE